MPIRDFLTSVRVGAGLVSPTATVDSPTLDAATIERTLRGAALWLTPRVVESFDPEDFSFLADDERQDLAQAVTEFRAATQGVRPDAPATAEEINLALPHLQRIIEIVRPDLYGDADALVAGKRVQQELSRQLPTWIQQLRFDTRSDANGEPALWVWVVADDAAMHKGVLGDNTNKVRQLIQDAVSRLTPQYWPYVRFRSASEQLQQTGAA